MKRRNGRTAEQKRALEKRIAECRDPIIRMALECYRNGESVERIAKATGIGEGQVRRICKG